MLQARGEQITFLKRFVADVMQSTVARYNTLYRAINCRNGLNASIRQIH
jgi:hypothetical protein